MCALNPEDDRIDRRVPPALHPTELRSLAAERGETPLGPRALLLRVVGEMRELAGQRGLEVWSDIGSGVPNQGRFDHEAVASLLRNLLTHSLRVVAHGSAGALAYARGRDEVVVEVLHSGPGIRVAEFERLRCEAGHPLARARILAQRLGVDLVYERSHRASGVYRFRFPVAVELGPGARASGRWSSAPPLSGSVLLVDGDGENRRLLRRQFEDLGVSVGVAESSLGAVDSALFGRYDVVLLGLETPGLNPFGTARVLRRAGFGKKIVALSSASSPELRERSAAAGIDSLLIRPVDRLTVVDLCVRFIPNRLRKLS